jgi:acylphosphatase
MKHINVTVTGLVQGVYFRASTKEVADNLGIFGFVKNLPDGSVYLEAEGEDDALEQLYLWLEEGPPAARVDHLQIEKGLMQQLEGFVIS